MKKFQGKNRRLGIIAAVLLLTVASMSVMAESGDAAGEASAGVTENEAADTDSTADSSASAADDEKPDKKEAAAAPDEDNKDSEDESENADKTADTGETVGTDETTEADGGDTKESAKNDEEASSDDKRADEGNASETDDTAADEATEEITEEITEETTAADAAEKESEAAKESRLSEEIVGTWTLDGITGLKFSDNGRGKLTVSDEEYSYKYKINGEKLSILFASDRCTDSTFTAAVSGDTLYLEVGTSGAGFELSRTE